jgi:hypothetical protein
MLGKMTYITGRGRWRRSKLNVKGTNPLDHRQHFGLLCGGCRSGFVCVLGGGGVKDPAPFPHCSIWVSRGDVLRSDPDLLPPEL